MTGKKGTEEAFRASIVSDRRPWGLFRRYPHENAGSIKIVTVDPGGVLSLQLHEKRDEFWVVLDPGLEVVVGDRAWRPAAGEEVFVPRRTAHRARNLGAVPARFMEIWIGKSSESDIVRLKDEYNRR